MIYEEDHYTKYYPHHEDVAKFMKGTSQLVQQQHLVAQNPTPPQGGNTSHSHHGDASLSSYEMYMFKTVNVNNQENTYDTPAGDHVNGKAIT
jgi:hypothetical protein